MIIFVKRKEIDAIQNNIKYLLNAVYQLTVEVKKLQAPEHSRKWVASSKDSSITFTAPKKRGRPPIKDKK